MNIRFLFLFSIINYYWIEFNFNMRGCTVVYTPNACDVHPSISTLHSSLNNRISHHFLLLLLCLSTPFSVIKLISLFTPLFQHIFFTQTLLNLKTNMPRGRPRKVFSFILHHSSPFIQYNFQKKNYMPLKPSSCFQYLVWF